MEFEKFVETVKDTIKDYLPEEYASASIEVMQHEKLNDSYLGMTVTAEYQAVAPTLNLHMFYDQLMSGQADLKTVMGRMADVVQMEPLNIDVNILTNYETAKDRLFIRISGTDRNEGILNNIPHTRIENLAITYHIAANMGDEGLASAPVTNQMLHMFGITKEQLHQDALENSPRLFPAKVESLNEMMDKMVRDDMRAAGVSEEDIDQMLEDMNQGMDTPLTVVTNNQQLNGAAVLFYPGQMDQIGESVKGDFFILPSSIHEMLVLPDDGDMSYQELKEMVVDVNNTQVSPDEKLADEVYHYDTRNRVFEKASSFEERIKNTMKEQDIPGKKEHDLSQPVHKPKQRANEISL